MSVIFAVPNAERTWEAQLTDAAFALKLRRQEDIPWWAVELLELRDPDEIRVRELARYNRIRFPRMWNAFADIVTRAEQTVMRKSIEEWRDLCYDHTDSDGFADPTAQVIRDAALYNPRAFVKFCDIRDHEGEPVDPADFHMRMLSAMRRTQRLAMVEVFYSGGKSWNSSILVPLMDWAEEPRATEGRIYLDEDTVKRWTGLLMQEVEENDSLHKLFPWVRKPTRNDPGYKIWSYDGFAIGGNPKKIRSFEAHTIGSSKTGFRFWRTGVDDIVSDKEANTASIQERNVAYIKRVALTMRQRTRRPRSKYGTVFPGFYIVGTPYARGDANVQLKEEYKQNGYKVVSVPIFVNSREPNERPRWTAVHDMTAIQIMRREMGARAFNMRCRLEVGGREHSLFPEIDVDWALKDGRADVTKMRWCDVPANTRLIIGFDPASGHAVQHHGARDAAWVVYGVRDMTAWMPQHPSLRDFGPSGPPPQQRELFHHVVQWGRMEGLGQHGQCQLLVDLAHTYQCPIAFENNTLQESYGEYLQRLAPDVKTFSHTTGMNKRDPAQGVDQFEPLFTNRRMVIHAEGAPPDQVKALRDELINWRGSAEKNTGFTDLIMALWIGRYQFALHVQAAQPIPQSRRPIPAYAARFQQPWYRQR